MSHPSVDLENDTGAVGCVHDEQQTRDAHWQGHVTADRDELLRRLDAGEWMTSGDVAVVLKIGRRTVKNMLDDGRLGWRIHPAGGRIKEIDPADVWRILEARKKTQRGKTHRIEPVPEVVVRLSDIERSDPELAELVRLWLARQRDSIDVRDTR